MKMAWCIWIVMNVYYKERIWIYYLISFYSKMQPLFCLVPTNLSTQFPSWHELTQRPHNSAISVPDLKWSYFAFKGSEQLELPLNWNRIGPLGIEVNEKIFHSVSIFQYPLSQAAADLQPYGCFIFLYIHLKGKLRSVLSLHLCGNLWILDKSWFPSPFGLLVLCLYSRLWIFLRFLNKRTPTR